MSVHPGRWLGRSAQLPRAPARLFCFAHAGGGGAFFRPWQEALLPGAQVCPVVLPGREARIGEKPFTRIQDLVDPLVEGLLEFTDRPYALFGHSMGSVVAYEVARRLQDEGERPPSLLFASGRRAPHLPSRRPLLHVLSDDGMLDAVSRLNGTPADVLQQDDLIRFFLPTLRADFALNETYRPLPGSMLRCPVAALTGDADPEVDLDEMAGWRAVTSAGFTLRVFRGDHFYLRDAPAEVTGVVAGDLRRVLADGEGAQLWAEPGPACG